MIKIGIDLRGLNDPHLTGVNTYIMHALWELHNHKPAHWSITSIGITKPRREYLWQRFPFLSSLFDTNLTLQDYFKTPLPNKFLQLYSLYQHRSAALPEFDVLYLPQPRALTVHPKTQVIVTFHDLYYAFNPDSGGFSNLTKRMLDNPKVYRKITKEAAHIFAVSLSTALDIEKKLSISHERISWVYPGFPDWQFDTKKELGGNIDIPPQPYVVAISGWEWRKNWLNIILAHKKALEDPDYRLHIIFAGFPSQIKLGRYLKRLIRTSNIKHIHFMDAPSDSQKKELIKHSRGTLYPSWYEGFGFPILESFSQGKPVMYGIYGSGYEVAGEAGIPVNPGIISELSFGLQLLARDSDTYLELCNRAREAYQQYSWLNWYQQFEKSVIALTKDH